MCTKISQNCELTVPFRLESGLYSQSLIYNPKIILIEKV